MVRDANTVLSLGGAGASLIRQSNLAAADAIKDRVDYIESCLGN